VYWDVPTADCYVGLPTRWYISVWGYHYFESSLVSELAFEEIETRSAVVKPGFAKLLGMYGVTHVLSAFPASAPGLTPIGGTSNALVYRVDGTSRVRVVPGATVVPNEDRAGLRLHDPSFDPLREVLLMDDADARPPRFAAGSGARADDTPGTARIVRESDTEVVVDAAAPQDEFLLLADSYDPGWRADVDGVATRIYRADISLRAVALPRGSHVVRFEYHPAAFFRAIPITLSALCLLAIWTLVAAYRAYA
jgi:hypothetical protein